MNQPHVRKTGFGTEELELYLWFGTYQPWDARYSLASIPNLWGGKVMRANFQGLGRKYKS